MRTFLFQPIPFEVNHFLCPLFQLTWVADVKEKLNAGEAARDVTTAELYLKNHQDLCDDIRAHQDEYAFV